MGNQGRQRDSRMGESSLSQDIQSDTEKGQDRDWSPDRSNSKAGLLP